MTPTELAERAEKATGPDRELEWAIIRAIHPGAELVESRLHYDAFSFKGGYFKLSDFRYTASIDAAMSLVPEGWGWMIHWPENSQYRYARVVNPAQAVGGARDGYAATPALALVAAALRARDAK